MWSNFSDIFAAAGYPRPSAEEKMTRQLVKWRGYQPNYSLASRLVNPLVDYAHHTEIALKSVRATGESLITGSLIGAASGAGMLDVDGVPMDLAGGILATVLGVAAANSEIGSTLRTAGHTAIGIFGFRKTEEWLGVRKASVHGDAWSSTPAINTTGTAVDNDPIIAAARSI